MNYINKVLVVAPDFPYPPTYGGAADIWGRLLILEAMRLEVHLVCVPKYNPQKEDIDVVKAHVASLEILPRKNRILDLFDQRPLQVASRKSLKHHTFSTSFDLVLLESEYVGAVLENPSLQYSHISLRVHNNEASYFQSLYKASTGLSKPYYALESFKFRLYKSFINKQISNFLFISSDECASFLKQHETLETKAIHLPPPLPKVVKNRALTSKNVLFVGSLFMPNNIEALKWYLDQVHPGLRDIEGYKLIIAGSTKGKTISFLSKLASKDNRISYYPDVDDLEDIYAECSVFINPMRNGAGVKMKSIHAIQEGLPVVSTTVGMEGTGLLPDIHYIQANTPDLFANAVKNLLEDANQREAMIKQAQAYLVEHYDHTLLLKKFFEAIALNK